MNQKDTGWLQVYCESNQEALDTILMGYKIAESQEVMLPLMSMEDAFILSHTSEPVNIPDQDEVDEFLPKLDLKNPMGYGSYSPPDGPFMELKVDFMESMKKSKHIIKRVTDEFERTFGRDYSCLIEKYRMDDAKYGLVASGTLASTGKYVVNKLREEGEKVGLIRLRFFKPFPDQEIIEAVSGLDSVGVLDRSVSMAPHGSTAMELRSALYGSMNMPISGLGGRDVRIDDFLEMFSMIKKRREGNYYINGKGVR